MISNGMRPQDIIILLKIIVLGNTKWHNKDIANELYISGAEVSKSLDRCQIAGLISPDRKSVFKQSLMEFIQFGLRYVFPAKPGSLVNGTLTAHSHPFMAQHFKSDYKYVWPNANGHHRGLTIEPLYPTVTKAIDKDQTLYKLLALVDVIRVGKTREVKVAVKELKEYVLK